MPKSILDLSDADNLTNEILQGFVDSKLVDKETQKNIDKLITKHGKNIFPLLIYKLTSIEFPPAKAKEIWEGIIGHLEHLNKLLRRNVGLLVALSDYIANIGHKFIKFPIIIDNDTLLLIKKNLLVDIESGFYNFNYYSKRIKEEVAKAKRYNEPLSILMLDIDDVRKIKEYSGTDEANIMIKLVGDNVKTLLRTSDVIIHNDLGGYIIILPQTSKKQALIVGEKLRKKVENLNLKNKLTISGGVATFLVDTKKDATELLNVAKSALYRAKIEGKNRICIYTDEKRKFNRIPITEQIKIDINIISPIEIQQHIKKVKDISKGGIAFYIENVKLNPMEFVKGSIIRDNNEIKFVGQIVWVSKIEENLSEIGIKFL